LQETKQPEPTHNLIRVAKFNIKQAEDIENKKPQHGMLKPIEDTEMKNSSNLYHMSSKKLMV
jgi:hypothetical protein